MPQLTGSFAAVWDDVLPLTPEDVWRAEEIFRIAPTVPAKLAQTVVEGNADYSI